MSLHFVHPVDEDDTVSLSSKDSTTSTGSKLSRDSGFSAKRISLTRELQNLRRQMNKRMCCESELRFTQMEALGRCLEEERVVHVLKHEEQDDRIAELESYQKQLGLEQKAHSELIDSDTLKFKELTARINSLSRKGEVRDSELIKLTQRIKETSAECNVKFEDNHTRHAEDHKICQNNIERCSQLEELMQHFKTHIAETNAKLSKFEAEHALHTRKVEGQDDRIAEVEFFQKQFGLERKAQSEQIDSELVLNTCKIEELAARIDSLSCKVEVRDNELMELAQRFKETSAEGNDKLENSHTRRAEDRKICQTSNERCSQLEELMQRLETQIADTNAKLSELETEHAWHTHSELLLNTCKIEELAARIDSISCKGEVHDNELMELAQLFKETSAEGNVKFEDSHKRRAEDCKICQNNNERCSQSKELMRCFETQIAETNAKISEYESKNALHTRKVEEQDDRIAELESRLASECKTCQELTEGELKSHASGVQDHIAMFNARIGDLTICLDAGHADHKEKLKEQNQAEISSRTLETTLAEKISSQKKLIEAETISRMRIAPSSDRESHERHMQLQDLESPVKAEIETHADTIQERKTHLEAVVPYFARIGVPFVCFFFLHRARIEKLAHSIVVGFAAEILPKCRGE